MSYFSLKAQQKDSLKLIRGKKDALYIGSYAQLTLNYERILFSKNKNTIIARLSGAYWENNENLGNNFPKVWSNKTYLGLGLIYAKSFKNPNHHLDIEFYYLNVKGTEPSVQTSITGSILGNITYPYLADIYAIKSGWRRQRPDGGWLWRVNISIGRRLENFYHTTVFYPEVCLGYSF
ncbi:MAG: hypothetical protein EAZ06_08625 [Cytophagales bacterium]|nr:MAG: hypothetical protein EAZ06_08625 [Cytophagales bacterium]